MVDAEVRLFFLRFNFDRKNIEEQSIFESHYRLNIYRTSQWEVVIPREFLNGVTKISDMLCCQVVPRLFLQMPPVKLSRDRWEFVRCPVRPKLSPRQIVGSVCLNQVFRWQLHVGSNISLIFWFGFVFTSNPTPGFFWVNIAKRRQNITACKITVQMKMIAPEYSLFHHSAFRNKFASCHHYHRDLNWLSSFLVCSASLNIQFPWFSHLCCIGKNNPP